MAKGILGKKIGMTQIFEADGRWGVRNMDMWKLLL